MTDRIVQRLDSAANRSLRFSECLQLPNIVLLGDPGAGKSHLFRTFSPTTALFRARDFLNLPLENLREHSTIFIDALDEKRSGRTDVAPIDLIVTRLMELRPSRLRIACRAADWLGTSDLGAFRPYFDTSGGFTVLALDALTEGECAEVLTSLGCSEPSAFIAEANARGVGDLLGNPQNLTMLFHVVQSHDWPHTRYDLYEKAVELLLVEHNQEHQSKDAGVYSAKELIRASGAACAARLIADVSGIALTAAKIGGCPSYRELTFVPAPELHAALTRRVFSSTGISDTVDYSHRTVAEYLAAHFLAHQVQRGLPFGRVRAIISVDGRPASELRGLHAWLAVLLPEHADELISADPFGVLSYGDAAALSVVARATLLKQISALAKDDPWFRHGNWSAAPMRGLAGVDMVDQFREILEHSDNYSLVSVVLDAASVGTPMPALKSDLLRILSKSTRQEGERLKALEALLHLGPAAHASCVAAYVSIAVEPGGFHCRTRILRRLLQEGLLGAKEIADLLNDGLAEPRGDIVRMGFYNFADQLDDQLLKSVLDCVQLQRLPEKSPESHISREALQLLDRLLARYVVLNPEDLEYVAKWLSDRAHITRYRGYGVDEVLQNILKSNPERLERLIDAALPHVKETQAWPIVIRLGQIFPGAADAAAILNWALRKLDAAQTTPDRLLYAIAMECVFWPLPPRRAEFEHLLTLASRNPSLQPICDAASCSPIPEWRIEESERRANNAVMRAQDRSKTHEDFDNHAEAIRNGTQLGWLGHIANVYFCRYSDCKEGSAPRVRLIDFLGVERADTALAGLEAIVASGHAPAIPKILSTHASESVFPWWYAIVAGLDEYTASKGNLGAISPEYLAAALAIDVLYPTFEHAGNTTTVIRHAWAVWFAEHHPKRYADTLLTVVQFRLVKNSQYLDGFSELIKLPATFQHPAVRELLTAFPQAPANYLVELLRAWISAQLDEPDHWLIKQGLKQTVGTASHQIWLAAALVIDFGGFRSQANALRKKGAQRALVLASRDLSGCSPRVPLAYTEYLFRLTCRCFARSEMHSTSIEDRHEWDATQFALGMLNTLAAEISDGAQQALRRALQDKGTRGFHDDIKHALAQQLVRRIDAEFRQPTWNSTVDTLANGAPASIADLQALVLAELHDLQIHYVGSNIDSHKTFWNEGPHGQVKSPKPENSCRNALVQELRRRMKDHGVRVEPEGQMARQRRADIAVTFGEMKLVLELKRHYHPDVWTAASEQLNRFYVRDPESKGFGIYLVLWFGTHRLTPTLGKGKKRPGSAEGMKTALIERLPADHRLRIACVVLDVSSGDSKRRTSNHLRIEKRKPSKRKVIRKKGTHGKK